MHTVEIAEPAGYLKRLRLAGLAIICLTVGPAHTGRSPVAGRSQESPAYIVRVAHDLRCPYITGPRPSFPVRIIEPGLRGGMSGIYCVGSFAFAVSPNGRLFAFTNRRQRLIVVHLHSTRETDLGKGTQPNFSYDSRYIAFQPPGSLGAERVDSLKGRAPRIVPVSRSHGYLAAEVAWAHHSDMLVGNFEGDSGGGGYVSMRNPGRVVILPSAGGSFASAEAWSWNDGGLLYWDDSVRWNMYLERQSLRSNKITRVGRIHRGCGKGCDWEAAPVPVPGGAASSQAVGPGQAFYTVRWGQLRIVRFRSKAEAGSYDVSVNSAGTEALLGFAPPGGQWIGEWRVGAEYVRPLRRALQAFWVSD